MKLKLENPLLVNIHVQSISLVTNIASDELYIIPFGPCVLSPGVHSIIIHAKPSLASFDFDIIGINVCIYNLNNVYELEKNIQGNLSVFLCIKPY